ncbi:type I-E CRISPR-associated endoribonuclease Cas2e [Pseudonocardia oroxyli]|uniref:CRISPR-associated protein Cas2 n=1 Tax=Pseudonocardia oroxyli TaxID=366584 RepID=A0A1G8AFZ6_PSEOR|nr:type I-E CRISPR-associated endoribonuclease Cas2e [Pseudonocardia oroxyli]SDH19882.1 CRISPR-associated protein Cas2 [Pseudonocardia oroxyli]
MTVIVVAACPVGLRGHLTRWLLEISAGVFVGRVSSRVRDLLWERTVDMVKSGRAIMVFAANNEQGLDFKVHKHEWTPVDIDGVTLMLRPNDTEGPSDENALRTQGWSSASRRRRFRKH